MPEIKWTKDLVAQKFARATPKEITSAAAGPTDLEWAYREAAAVLSSFQPDHLKPYGQPEPEGLGPIGQLLSDSTLTYDRENRPEWMLRHSVRREALRRLGSREAMRAVLAANPDRPTGLQQRMLELSIFDELPPLEEQSLEELESTLQAVKWLEGIVDPLPSQEEVQRKLEWERVLKPFKYLVGDDFCGRERELRQLREYVGLLPPGTVLESVVRGVREVLSLHEKPPLLIFGPGGIGKSTLVAKFILEHVEAGESVRFPFAYIDFDRPDMMVQEPATILVEVVRQLGIQYARTRELCDKVGQHWLRQISLAQADPSLLPATSYGTAKVAQTSMRDRSPVLDDLGKILQTIGEFDKPFLLILDTFEEIQYRSRDFVAELWNLLDELQGRVPRLRTVIAGRAPVGEFETQDLRLGDLDREAAECFLESHGITDERLTGQLVRQVGGNPLSLELAVEVIGKEGAGRRGIKDLGAWKQLWLQVQENSIQGYLYRRLLDHIPDPDVRKLAHPGLVLRRVTPELILEVLAEPCEVKVKDKAHAQQLFDKMRGEVTLIQVAEDGSLRHRTDVRRIMLDALRQDEPTKVLEIHRRAADYYYDQRERGTVAEMSARAEEIYHRLFFETNLARLDTLWKPGVEEHLYGAIDEVPPRAQPYLASQLGVTRDDLAWDEEGLDVWERYAEQRVRDLMRYGKWEDALEVLAEREERTVGSPLYLLEAQVLERCERWPEARRVAKTGIYSTSQSQNTSLLLDLLRLSARVDEHLGQYKRARQMLDEAKALVEKDDYLLRLEIAVNRLRLYRLEPSEDEVEVRAVQQEAAELFDRVSTSELGQNRQMLRDLALEIGVAYPHVFREVLRSQRPKRLDASQREALAQALAAWDTLTSQELGGELGTLARMSDIKIVDGVTDTWREFLRDVEPPFLSKVLERLLDKFPVPDEVARLIIDSLLVEEESAPQAAL